MSNGDFTLSICIPTYNRGAFLDRTLESIVNQAAFVDTNEVEIIISDNCSEDSTAEIAAIYAKKFPGRIKSHRNVTNVGPDINFEISLSLATGSFAKLHNDDLMVRNGSLTEILKVIKVTESEKPIIFMTNGNKYNGNPIEVCTDLNKFVTCVSFFCTWIGGFGIWRDDFKSIADFSRNPQSRLIQTDVLLRMLATGKRAIVLKDVYFLGQKIDKKGGYNIAEVFGKNYLQLLKPYLATGILNEQVFQIEKKEILLKHIIPHYFNKQNGYSKTGFFKYLEDYWNDDYFQEAIERIILNDGHLI